MKLVELGTIDLEDACFHFDPVWLAPGRLAVTTAIDTLTVVALAPGLPVVATTRFPGGMTLPRAPWDNFDLNYDRVGIHAAALSPAGDAFAIGGVNGEHERAMFVFGLDGTVHAASTQLDASGFGVDDEFLLCPIALAWARSLFLACSIENVTHVARLDPDLTVTGLVDLEGEFPEPAMIFPLAHPREDAAIFQIACGQDGAWLRAIAGAARVPTTLDDDVMTTSIFGFAPDGALITGDRPLDDDEADASYHARSWPSLAEIAAFPLGGACRGGAVLGELIAAALGDEIGLYRAGVREGRAPLDGYLVGGQDDCLVTRSGRRLTVWRVAP